MEHKCFSFDWDRFESELKQILEDALHTGSVEHLISFITKNLPELTDPYDGYSLKDNWQKMLINRDVLEYGDYALTKYYDVQDDHGLGYTWTDLSDQLPPDAARALLGFPISSGNSIFDPGRMGSYFQTPVEIQQSITVLSKVNYEAVNNFRSILQECNQKNLGVYITF
jgi:hypothetical protein